MARNSQTFKAVAKLEAGQFKREARNISRVVQSMRNTFMGFTAALGAGLGFGQLVSQMRKTAVEMSTAAATLENVSKQTQNVKIGTQELTVKTSNYGETLSYVEKLSSQYKQDLISLTNGYAQFKAAADQAGVSMKDQEKIYEALTRAATFFHLSGDRTNEMMMAVTQMMSKGKVASEELRRQLGNTLPGAFGIMAKAAQNAGISLTGSVSELEELMKKSKVMSAQVLPAFADELNKITSDLNMDSLQLTINELKNAWINLTREVNMEDFYNRILKKTTQVVNHIANNLRLVKADILGVFASILTFRLYDGLKKQGDQWLVSQKKNLGQLKTEYKKAYQELSAIEKKYPNLVQVSQDAQKGPKVNFNPTAQKQLSKHEIDEINNALSKTVNKWDAVNKQTQIVSKNYSGIALAGKGIVNVLKSIGATIASMGIIALASAVVGYLTRMISNAIQFKKELREISNIGADFGDGSKKAEDSIRSEIAQAKALLKIIKDSKDNDNQRLVAIRQLNELQGQIKGYTIDTKDTYDEIIRKTNGWLEELKKVAQVQLTLSQMQDNQNKLTDLKIKKELKEKEIREHQHGAGRDEYGNTVMVDNMFEGNKERKRELELIDAEIKKRQDLDESYKKILEDQQVELINTQALNDANADNNNGGDGGSSKKKSNVEKLTEAFDKYEESTRKLDNQLKRGAITQDEYDDSVEKLVTDTYKEVSAFEDLENIIGKVKDGEARLASLTEDFNQIPIWKQIKEDIKASEEELNKYNDALTAALIEWMDYTQPKEGKRESFFDYKYTKNEIRQQLLDIKSIYKKELEESIRLAKSASSAGVTAAGVELTKLEAKLKEVSTEIEDLSEKMKIAELIEDIEKSHEAFKDAIWGGVKSLAQALDRVGDGWKKIREAFGDKIDEDAWEHWEKFVSILNEIVQLFDMVNSAVEMFNNLQKISKTLTDATNAAKAKSIALSEGNAAAAQVEASTQANVAVANATASGAKLPFPANIVAIGAALAAVVAALATFGTFENGGFVTGGRKHGDHTLIRANAGEMVLNAAQQRNLLALANGRGGMSGDVKFRIRGCDLEGVLANERARRRG